MKDTIYCLFSIDNEYDQPDYNLVAWFQEKPSIEQIAKVLGYELKEDDTIVAIAKIWQGHEARINQTDYRFMKVKEGQVLGE